jgi:16S rRNA (cytidine1402-2'-O)-methyltransferase
MSQWQIDSMKKIKDVSLDDVTAPRRAGQSGMLYLVPTPIGNLGDITERARAILAEVDIIAAEDTRHTGSLLKHFGIQTVMLPCHDHNEQSAARSLVHKMQSGQNVALVSDAGTPLLSDPGYRLVQAAIEAHLPITALPGANAILPALQLSGLPAYPFYFGGFLPSRSKARKDQLAALQSLPATLVFYEAPHRLVEMLKDCISILGDDRRAAVVREISKRFEEVRRDSLRYLAEHYVHDDPRGEIVVVIHGATSGQKWSEAEVIEKLSTALESGAPFRESVMLISAQSHWPKRDVYDLALKQKAADAERE